MFTVSQCLWQDQPFTRVELDTLPCPLQVSPHLSFEAISPQCVDGETEPKTGFCPKMLQLVDHEVQMDAGRQTFHTHPSL